MSKVDAYNPDYYASMPVQPIMVMHACLTKEEFIGYLRGCLQHLLYAPCASGT